MVPLPTVDPLPGFPAKSDPVLRPQSKLRTQILVRTGKTSCRALRFHSTSPRLVEDIGGAKTVDELNNFRIVSCWEAIYATQQKREYLLRFRLSGESLMTRHSINEMLLIPSAIL